MNHSQLHLYQFNTDLAQPLTEKAAKIDETNGIIYGVSLITGGIEARGHGLEVDAKTLKQMLAAAEAKGQVSVKTNHGTGADAVNGYLNNFRIEGSKVVGDWHVLKTHPQHGHIMEMAKRMPKNIGLSAAFMGLPESKDGMTVFRGEDTDDKWRGKFYTINAGGKRVEFKDKKFARCDELVSVDLVAQPAANPDGLFNARVDMLRSGMARNNQAAAAAAEGEGGGAAEPTLADLLQAIQGMRDEFSERLEAMEQFQDEFLNGQGEEEGEEDEIEGEGEEGAEGELEHAGAGAGGERGFAQGTIGAVLNEFSTRLHQFEQREQNALKRAELAQQQHAFAVIANKVDEVTEFARALVTQNEAQSELIAELQAQLKNTARVSLGHENQTMFNTPSVPGQTEFETRCQELVKEGKTPGQASQFAMKENPARYQEHLKAKGVIVSA